MITDCERAELKIAHYERLHEHNGHKLAAAHKLAEAARAFTNAHANDPSWRQNATWRAVRIAAIDAALAEWDAAQK